MRAELESLLYQRYPQIFMYRHLPPEVHGLKWGIACGDGWFVLIDALCAEIQWQMDNEDMRPVYATQVKEKFGSLRFYFRGGNATTRALASLASRISEHIREDCDGNA